MAEVKILQPKAGENKREWEGLAPEKILTDKEVADLKKKIEETHPFTFARDIEEYVSPKLVTFAKENNINLVYLTQAVAANPVFNNKAIYVKGITAPNPEAGDTGRELDSAANSQDIWREFYRRYNVPAEVQKQLFDEGMVLKVSRLDEADFQYVNSSPPVISGNSSQIAQPVDDIIMSNLSHEVIHWYYERLPNEERQKVKKYFIEHPEYSDTIRKVGAAGYYKGEMSDDVVASEGFASSLFPGANSYGLLQRETSKISGELGYDTQTLFTPNWANRYHTFTPDKMQADIELSAQKYSRAIPELDINMIGR